MATGAVIRQLILQRVFAERGGRQERERRRGARRRREARERGDEAAAAERGEIGRRLRDRLGELVGEDQAGTIMDGINSGQITLADPPGTGALGRRHMTRRDLGAIPRRNYVNVGGVDFEDRTEGRVLSSLRRTAA
ncbi:TPA: hypothetical protein EYP38_01635 [Candidatus Micrarchaeota archaeon]|nr:hypothetical protein [Candidatus Micrarchaeota archaeon]